MNYTLHQLQIFLKVSETGSITKAAEELHLTQPAVSIQLKNLQQHFDIPLIEVVNKKVYITEFGNELINTSKRILKEIDLIEQHTMAIKGKLTGKLKIAAVSTGKYIAPYYLSGFHNKYDGVELDLDVSNKGKVLESLEKNEIDFAFLSTIPGQIKLKKIDLMQDKLFLVGNGDVKISKTATTREILESRPLIFRENGSATRLMMEKFLQRCKVDLKQKMELSSNEAVKQSIIAGLGISLMPLIGIKNELSLGHVKILPVKGTPINTSWNLIWLAEKKLSPVASAFADYIKQEKMAIFESHFSWTKTVMERQKKKS
jgi:DNA-binding transcriptional LysR family regulator